MTFIRVVDEDEAKGELQRVYEEVRKARGGLGNIWKAESLHPSALKAHLHLYETLMFGEGGLTRREREMVAVAVSVTNRSAYSIVHHADALGRYVTEPGLVPLLVGDPRKAPLGKRERALVDAAIKLTKDPGAWGKDDVETLRLAGFRDEDVLALAEIAAYFNFANRVANALGVTPEDADKSYNY